MGNGREQVRGEYIYDVRKETKLSSSDEFDLTFVRSKPLNGTILMFVESVGISRSAYTSLSGTVQMVPRMPPKLREEKKREILDHLVDHAEKDDVTALDINEICSRFSDESYSEDDIKGLIEELRSEDLIETQSARLRVAYPKSHEKRVKENFQELFDLSVPEKFAAGFISYIILLNWTPFYRLIDSDGSITANAYIVGGFYGILLSYILGSALIKLYSRLKSKYSIIEEHKQFIYAIGVILVGSTVVVYGASVYFSQELQISHVLAIISVSVLGGIPLGKYLSER